MDLLKSPAFQILRFFTRASLCGIIFCLLVLPAVAQESDSLKISSSKIRERDSIVSVHSVRKATVLSAVLPGAGQVYNRKAWKVPILYAGFAGLGYLIYFNQKKFNEFEGALVLRYDDNPATVDEYTDLYTDDNLRTLADFYRRNRDLSIMGLSIVYVLNIIDAHVDAHLFDFNMDDDLSLNWQPVIPFNPSSGSLSPGVQLTLRF